MTRPRSSPVPAVHLEAELAAFPLASEEAFRLGLTELSPLLDRGPTRRLWRAAEEQALGHFPGYSLDEAVAVRDHVWFGSPVQERPIHLREYLIRLARRYLALDGALARPTCAPDPPPQTGGGPPLEARARWRWRWLSFALPPDLLVAALGGPGSVPRDVAMLSPALARRLQDLGYAETHLHLGAAVGFPVVWAATMKGLASPAGRPDGFRSPGAAFEEGRDFGPWLLRAALARYVMAWFLARRQGDEQLEPFWLREVLPWIARRIGAGFVPATVTALWELRQGWFRRDTPGYSALREVYGRWIGEVRDARPQARHLDPIHRFLPPAGETGSADPLWVARSLVYLREHPEDRVYARLFWQVVRMRCLYYRHLVQRPMTPGLPWFIRHYDRLKDARHGLGTEARVRAAAQACGAGHGLRSLEMRDAPDRSMSRIYRDVRVVHELAPELSVPELGLVYHFPRDRGGGAREGRPHAHGAWSEADPRVGRQDREQSGNVSGLRYSTFFRARRVEALALAGTLRTAPWMLRLVRGLDACTDELGIPTWVLVPLFDIVRREAQSAAHHLARATGQVVPGLRTTVHVGEDFIHLLGGLRRVDEALRYLDLRQGDRIGHGLALGTDPEAWGHRIGRLPIPREERLLDLVWEWSCYARGQATPTADRHPQVEDQIRHLSERIFESPIAPAVLARLVDDLHDPRFLVDALGYPDRLPAWNPATSGRPERNHRLALAHRYLGDPSVFLRGREILWVDPGADRQALIALQNALRAQVASHGIFVEANPTSNLLIGNLGDLDGHPLWNLSPLRPDDPRPAVSLCIGSDDPLTFATTLPEEYQHLYDVMLLAGIPDTLAQDWLDRVRRNGLDARFTLPLATQS